MRNFIRVLTIIAIMVVIFCSKSKAQSRVIKTADGNYVMARKDTAGANKSTGQTITDDKGIKHPIFKSVHGKLFWMRTSKSGNVYKCYIKEA